jgi:AraC-like DNA-binding protein
MADTLRCAGVGRLNETRIGAVLAPAYGVRASHATASTAHAQHGAAVFVGLDHDVTVVVPTGRPVTGRVVAVPADLVHAARSPGVTLGVLVDPEAMPRVAAAIGDRRAAQVVGGRSAARLHAAVTTHRAALTDPDVLTGLAAEVARDFDATPRPRDRRVAATLARLRAPTGEPVDLAGLVRLSPAHLQALFVRDVGISIRRYRLWLRLLRALLAFATRDATAAAHAAGFADLAHFSRTCRRLLGYAPTALRDGLLTG